MPKVADPVRRERIARHYSRGLTASQVSRLLGVGKDLVRDDLRRAGVPIIRTAAASCFISRSATLARRHSR
jgi:hypothetical protein